MELIENTNTEYTFNKGITKIGYAGVPQGDTINSDEIPQVQNYTFNKGITKDGVCGASPQKKHGRPRKIITEPTEDIIKKKRGRPRANPDEPIVPKIKKTIGRPRKTPPILIEENNTEENNTEEITPPKRGRKSKYASKEEYMEAKRIRNRLQYDNKGRLYLKIIAFKRDYIADFDLDQLKGKTPEELKNILLELSEEVQKIKKIKREELIINLKNKIIKLESEDDLKPKSKYLTF